MKRSFILLFKKFGNKFLRWLLLYEKFEIETKLSKEQIQKRIISFVHSESTYYYGNISENGFFIAEKSNKHFVVVSTRNSFVPVAKAKITEKDGISTISVVIRMHILVLVLFAPIYFASLLSVVLFPFMRIFLYFTFLKPSKRLKKSIIETLY